MNSEFFGTSTETLMKNAGENASKFLIKNFKNIKKFQFFCGGGNNGGDGFVSAKFLHDLGFCVEVFLVQGSSSKLCQKYYELIPKRIIKKISDFEMDKKNVILDCILGIGIKGDLRKDVKKIVEILNKASGKKISFDVSTGGKFDADLVLSFHNSKLENKNFVEKVIDIGLPEKAENHFGTGDIYAYFPRRKSNSHKGENGKVLIIGGSREFHGAPLLSVMGAKTIAVDLIKVFVPKIHYELAKSKSNTIFVDHFKKDFLSLDDVNCILSESKNYNAVVIGPGLGKKHETKKAVCEILDKLKIPAVIDADAIFDFMDYKKIPKNSVFTPHEKEFERLQKCAILKKNSSVAILKKGKIDCVYKKNLKSYNEIGDATLSRGGTGDFLAGMIASLLARSTNNFYSAGIATLLLGIASENCKKKFGESYSFLDLKKEISVFKKY